MCVREREREPAGKRASSGEEEAASPRQAEIPAYTKLSATPVRQISSSVQRPDLAEFLAPRCSAIGEPCADLPCFKAPSPGRSRLCEARKRHWRLPGFSSTPALPLHLVPSVLEEGLGAGGLHTAKGSSSEISMSLAVREMQNKLQ